MSASREKKSRHDDGIQGFSAQEQHRRKEAEAHKHARIYGAIVGVVVVLALCLLVWNSGFIQRRTTAVTINDEKYTAVDLQFYYNTAYNGIVNQYTSVLGMPPFNPNQSLKEQVVDKESGKTWYDQIMETALNSMVLDTAMVDKAEAEGHTLSEAGQENLDATISQLDSAWAAHGFPSRDAFIRANFGTLMTYDRLVQLLHDHALATDYAGAHVDVMLENEYPADKYTAYYNENKDQLDTYTYDQVIFQATVATKDADGNPIEMSEEEMTAAMDKAKAETKAKADALLARLNAGEKLTQELVDELGDSVFNSTLDMKRTGDKVNSAYSEWMMDPARKAGDTTLAEYDGGTIFNYYVVCFHDRKLDESATADVRHILVPATTDGSAPTQEQYDQAKAKAQELMDQWKAGDATEESFSALAAENSADTGSAANGGMIAGVSSASTFIPGFTQWALDPARKPGDVGLVQNTGSSIKGWHVMYYSAQGDPVWKLTALNSFLDDDYSAWEKTIVEGYKAELASGAKFVAN